MERDQDVVNVKQNIMHFNSHAHVERDDMFDDEIENDLISTHTLTWSVTLGLQAPERVFGISTHTLTWSVTMLTG